jgi:hypothetical protein
MYDREILSLATLHEPKFTVRKKIPVENFIMKPLIHGIVLMEEYPWQTLKSQNSSSLFLLVTDYKEKPA